MHSQPSFTCIVILLQFMISLLLSGQALAGKRYKYGEESRVTKDSYNMIYDRVEDHYSEVFENLGGQLITLRIWANGGGTVRGGTGSATRGNAQNYRQWKIKVGGAMAGLPYMTNDALSLVICHEVGHHLAGNPKLIQVGLSWASSEGQSDYFAPKCFKKIYKNDDNINIVKNFTINKKKLSRMNKKCTKVFKTDKKRALCIRSLYASDKLTFAIYKYYKNIPSENIGKKNVKKPSLFTRDNTVMNAIKLGGSQAQHAKISLQCRLDTFVAGTLCNKDANCYSRISKRPACWFGR